MANQNQSQKIISLVIFILALALLFLVVRPMIIVLLSSVLIAYISFPLYKIIFKKIPNKPLSIILSLLIILIVLLIPFSFLAFNISRQGYYLYNSLSDNFEKGAIFGISCNSEESSACLLINQAEKFSHEQLSKLGLDNVIIDSLPLVSDRITKILLSLPLIIAKTFLAFIIAYFILKDWRKILKKIEKIFSLENKKKKQFIEDFENITYTVIYAQLFVAVVQGVIATIGFYIFGVPFPLILGVLLALFALVPFVGTGMIWVPASAYLIFSGYFSKNYFVLGKGIALFLYGLLIITTIDDILLAKIVQAKAKVNPIIVIVGVIGGASLFGFVGIFIGPILLPLLLKYLETFNEG